MALFSFNDINLPNNLLPVAITFKKFSCSLTSNIILRALKFASKDCRHIQLAAAALWSVQSEFGSGYCWLVIGSIDLCHIIFCSLNSEPSKLHTGSNELKMVSVYRNRTGYIENNSLAQLN